MSHTDRLPLGQQMLRGAGIFQAVVALPIFIFLGFEAFVSVLEPWGWLLYYFLTDTITAIMAGGIIFSVYVQRKAAISPYLYLLFEAAKSVLATGLWVWLILDSAFGPWLDHCDQLYWCDPKARITRSAFAIVLLFVFFYPPLAYAYLVWKGKSEVDEELEGTSAEPGHASERSALLS